MTVTRYVVWITEDGVRYGSQPIRSRDEANRVARECGGYVETMQEYV